MFNTATIIKNSPIILIGIIVIISINVGIPMIILFSSKIFDKFLTSNFTNVLLELPAFCVGICGCFGFSWIVHNIFLPHFIIIDDTIKKVVNTSKYSLYVMGVFLLFELVLPFFLSYLYIVKTSNITLSFLSSNIQNVKMIFVVVIVLLVFFKNFVFGSVRIMADWLTMLLTVLLASLQIKDMKMFVSNYYIGNSDELSNTETLTDLDPQTLKELENVEQVVTI
ncbi:Uncharacterized protein QTN25_008800 [Entamoeba marina]